MKNLKPQNPDLLQFNEILMWFMFILHFEKHSFRDLLFKLWNWENCESEALPLKLWKVYGTVFNLETVISFMIDSIKIHRILETRNYGRLQEQNGTPLQVESLLPCACIMASYDKG